MPYFLEDFKYRNPAEVMEVFKPGISAIPYATQAAEVMKTFPKQISDRITSLIQGIDAINRMGPSASFNDKLTRKYMVAELGALTQAIPSSYNWARELMGYGLGEVESAMRAFNQFAQAVPSLENSFIHPKFLEEVNKWVNNILNQYNQSDSKQKEESISRMWGYDSALEYIPPPLQKDPVIEELKRGILPTQDEIDKKLTAYSDYMNKRLKPGFPWNLLSGRWE